MAYANPDVLIYTALRDHLELNKGSLIVGYDGEVFEPPRDQPFFFVNDTRNNPVRIAWGDNCPVDRSGSMFINARIPFSLKWSVIQQMGFAGEVDRIFPNGTVVERNGVVVKITNQPALIGRPYADGGNVYMHYPMAVQWRSFC